MSFKRLLSSSASPITLTLKPTPSKAHHHHPLPATAFPSGFLLGGLHVGVKKAAGVPDLAIILSTSSTPTAAAASFTRNTFRAAPVLVSEDVLQKSGGWARALVVNSGCANAVTGRKGLEDAWKMVEETDALLSPLSSSNSNSNPNTGKETLVMSTGVIGQLLPIDAIISGIRSQASTSPTRVLGADFSSWENAAKAFMTTDTFPKLRARTFVLGGREYRMAGMTKGAGMIHPNMAPAKTEFGPLHATLLGCIMTDLAINPRSLQSALTYAVDRSFNSISVDGDMSTNDTICVLANGAAAPDGLVLEEGTQEYEIFKEELTVFAADLAKLVVRDGEGATKFVTVTVKVRLYYPIWGLQLPIPTNREHQRTKTHTASHPGYPPPHSSKQHCTAKTPSLSYLFFILHLFSPLTQHKQLGPHPRSYRLRPLLIKNQPHKSIRHLHPIRRYLRPPRARKWRTHPRRRSPCEGDYGIGRFRAPGRVGYRRSGGEVLDV